MNMVQEAKLNAESDEDFEKWWDSYYKRCVGPKNN